MRGIRRASQSNKIETHDAATFAVDQTTDLPDDGYGIKEYRDYAL
jgi:hypothetical protein